MSYKANNECGFSSFGTTNINDTYLASSCFDIGNDCWKPNVNLTGYGDDAYLSTPFTEEAVTCLSENNVKGWFSQESLSTEEEDEDGDSSAYKSSFSIRTLTSSLLLLMASLTLVSAKDYPAVRNSDGSLSATISGPLDLDEGFQAFRYTPTCQCNSKTGIPGPNLQCFAMEKLNIKMCEAAAWDAKNANYEPLEGGGATRWIRQLGDEKCMLVMDNDALDPSLRDEYIWFGMEKLRTDCGGQATIVCDSIECGGIWFTNEQNHDSIQLVVEPETKRDDDATYVIDKTSLYVDCEDGPFQTSPYQSSGQNSFTYSGGVSRTESESIDTGLAEVFSLSVSYSVETTESASESVQYTLEIDCPGNGAAFFQPYCVKTDGHFEGAKTGEYTRLEPIVLPGTNQPNGLWYQECE